MPLVVAALISAGAASFSVAASYASSASTDTVTQPQINVDNEIGNLGSGDVPARLSSARKLGTVRDDKAFLALTSALKDEKNPLMRPKIVEAIGNSVNPGAPDALIDIVKNEKDETVRGTAMRALGYTRSGKAAAALLDVFGNENEQDGPRIAAANALKMQDPTRTIFDALVKGMKSKSQQVGETSVNALADMYGPLDKDGTVNALKKLDAGSGRRVRGAAKDRLDKIELKPVNNGNKRQ